MRKLAEVEALLNEPYNGPTFDKAGNTYAPWNEKVKIANRIFGIDGWDFTHTPPRKEGNVYTCEVRVTVYTQDGRPVVHSAPGVNDITSASNAIDTAVKGCVSDGLGKALSHFGEALGLNLYGKQRGGNGGSSSSNGDGGASSGGNGNGGQRQMRDPDGPASPKQVDTLRKCGATEAQLKGITKARASALMDAAKANGWKVPQDGPAEPARSLADEMADELNFDEDSDY